MFNYLNIIKNSSYAFKAYMMNIFNESTYVKYAL